MGHYDVSGGCQLLYHLEQTPPDDPQYEMLCRQAEHHINALKRAMRYRKVGRPKATYDEEGVRAAVEERLQQGMKKTPAYREVGELFGINLLTVKNIYSD